MTNCICKFHKRRESSVYNRLFSKICNIQQFLKNQSTTRTNPIWDNDQFQHLTERGWYAVTETCLAFTVFRDDFSPKFVMQFTFLLFLKCFHWLSEDRVDYMERSPVITILFHARMMGALYYFLFMQFIAIILYWERDSGLFAFIGMPWLIFNYIGELKLMLRRLRK